MGFKKVEIKELEIEIKIYFFTVKTPSIKPGLIDFQLQLQPESSKAKILNPIEIGL